MYFKAGKNDKICANSRWVILLTDWRTISLLADLVWDLFVWVESESVDKMSLAQSLMAQGTLQGTAVWFQSGDLWIHQSYHNTSQPAETAPSTREMQFHLLNLSVRRINARMRRPIVFQIWLWTLLLIIMQQRGRLGHARTNFLQWHFNRQFLFATQICSKATW